MVIMCLDLYHPASRLSPALYAHPHYFANFLTTTFLPLFYFFLPHALHWSVPPPSPGKVNGKVRAELELSKTASSDDARALAEVLPQVSTPQICLDCDHVFFLSRLCLYLRGSGSGLRRRKTNVV